MAKPYSKFNRSVDRLQKAGQKKALQTFHEAARRVPAYRDFLDKNGVKPKSIRSFGDFQSVPLVTKENYLRQYPLKDLTWDDNQFSGDIISVSSGSSGEPFFWLRDKAQHQEAAEIYYNLYKNTFNADEVPTLLVVCFSMGIWIAGSYTTLGAMASNWRGLKINTVTPALDINDSIAVIKRLQKDYQQIVLAGYPPFLKDLIDRGNEEGIDWSKLNVGFTAAGEAIGEELRDYLLKNGSRHRDPTRVASIYGTVDAGIVAHETPLSVVIRRLIYKNNLQQNYFGRTVLPTLAQYDPTHKYIEIIDENIVFTSSTALPLVRYNIKDLGGSFTKLDELVRDKDEFKKAIQENHIDLRKWAHPFVYVHGRADFTASLYAVLIYPENIKKGLLNEQLTKHVSGRFVMGVKHKKNLDQYLELIVELKPGIKPDRKTLRMVESGIIDTLLLDNFEYRKLKNSIGTKAIPVIILKKADDPEYFSRSTNKHSWTAKVK